MSSAMDRYVEVVKQYPDQQQVDSAVEIEVPGSWFGVGPIGALTPTQRREKYGRGAGSRVLRGARISRGFQDGTQDKGKGHLLHLRRGRSTRAEFRGLLYEAVAVEPLPQ